MVTAILVLILVALAVTLSIVRPSGEFVSPRPIDPDRDSERMFADLRALPDYRPDARLR